MLKKIALILFAALLMCACAVAEDAKITVTDMFGRDIVLDEPATRVIALTPADCEILCAIGCEDMLVARGEFCDYPESILDLPALSTGENLNIEQILAFDPQIILMSDMNQSIEQVHMLEDSGIKVVVSESTDIQGVYEAISMIGALCGRSEQAAELVAGMRATFDYISAACEPSEKTIYFEVMPLEWGLWSAGANTFMHELSAICGMRNAFEDVDGWQPINEEQILARDPDYIVLVTGLGDGAVDEVVSRPGWGDLKAVAGGAVFNADSYAMTRPGPRLRDAAIDLYEFLYGVELDESAITID